MNKLVLWFVKITGFIPQLFYLRKKIYYENKKLQSRRIKSSAIVVANHKSLWDFALLMYVFMQRDIYTFVGEVMFNKGKLFAWFLRKLGCIKIERFHYDVTYMDKAKKVLKNKKVLEIYPEGRLPLKHETELLPFKPGAVHLALETNTRIIPVFHDGNYGKKGGVSVIIGTPIDLTKLYDNSKSEKENVDYLNNYLKEKIYQLGLKLNEIKKTK